MRTQNQKLLALAHSNLQIGLRLTETLPAYVGNIECYKANVLASLSVVLETLSGIFCELSKHQNVNDAEVGKKSVFYQKLRPDKLALDIKAFLCECERVLASSSGSSVKTVPFTLMYTRAQTLSFELRGKK
jgi:hypothetical protein